MPRRGLQVTGQSINITFVKWSYVYEVWQWMFQIDINVTTYNVMVTEATRCSSGISGKVSELKIRSNIVIELSVTLVGVDIDCDS